MASTLSITTLSSKFRGCMLGALLGDCLGAPFEGVYPISQKGLSDYFTNLLSGGTIKIYPYTDDTEMSLSVARSLVENKNFDPVDMAKRFATEFFKSPQRGYGRNVVCVFLKLKDSGFEDVFLPAKLQFDGSGSYGNGAAMRIAALPLFGHKKGEQYIVKTAEDISLLTHAHPFGYNGAILQCLAIHTALNLDASQEFDTLNFISCLQTKMENIEKGDEKPYSESLKKIKEIYVKKQDDISAKEIAEYLGNDISAHRSVPTAIFSFLRGFKPLPNYECSNPFVRTLYFAISVGGDTDTIATMAGSIAGAYYGANHVPETLIKRCEAVDEVIKLSENIFKISEEET